jgi:hypothetical protein
MQGMDLLIERNNNGCTLNKIPNQIGIFKLQTMELTWCQDISVNNLYGLNLGQHIQTVKAELWLKPFTEVFPVYCQILSPLVCLSMPEASLLTMPEFYAH